MHASGFIEALVALESSQHLGEDEVTNKQTFY